MSAYFQKLKAFLILPPVDSEAESDHLKRTNWLAILAFSVQLPVFLFIAWMNETGIALTAGLTGLALVGPFAAYFAISSQRTISVIMGMTSMFMGGILVHIGQGPAQIEMHFYFFVSLALLVAYRNPLVIVAAAATSGILHVFLWLFYPVSMFEHEAPLWLLGIHAGFITVQATAISIVARHFYDSTAYLEHRVAMRSAQFEFANRETREFLDSVEQGFLKLDCMGQIGKKYSRAVIKLLGKIPKSRKFSDLLAIHHQATADWFEIGLDDVFAGIMPLELTIDQLPKQIKSNSRYMSLQYIPIFEKKELTHLIVVVSDISAEVEREKLEVENREFLAIIDRISTDQVAFLEFIAESETLINKLRDRPTEVNEEIKRDIHTLKGNAAVFGLVRVADACHAIEDHIAENNEFPSSTLWTELFQAWASTRGKLRRLMADSEIKVTLSDDEYSSVLLAILNNAPKSKLVTRVAAWRLEPTRRRLDNLAEQAVSLGIKLGKGVLNVTVEDNGLRTDPKNWSKFWSSMVHVMRNSVDHGMETMDERSELQKLDKGNITLSTLVEGDKYIVSIKDDGRGINWEQVRAAAQRKGLTCDSEQDLKEALFHDGLSTCSSVTEISGRGVGMAAVHENCRALGGTIEINSELGVGTEFRFVFPVGSMAPDMHALLTKHGIENPNAITCNTANV